MQGRVGQIAVVAWRGGGQGDPVCGPSSGGGGTGGGSQGGSKGPRGLDSRRCWPGSGGRWSESWRGGGGVPCEHKQTSVYFGNVQEAEAGGAGHPPGKAHLAGCKHTLPRGLSHLPKGTRRAGPGAPKSLWLLPIPSGSHRPTRGPSRGQPSVPSGHVSRVSGPSPRTGAQGHGPGWTEGRRQGWGRTRSGPEAAGANARAGLSFSPLEST